MKSVLTSSKGKTIAVYDGFGTSDYKGRHMLYILHHCSLSKK